MVDEVKAALLLVKNIGDSPARLSVIKVSGSIAKLKSYQRKI
jgi:RNase P/RNase MRP subunit POP5